MCIALGDENGRRAPTKEPRSLCILRPSGDRAYLTPSSSLRRTTHDKRWIAVTVAKSPARMKRTRLVELDTPARPFPQPYDLAAYPRLYSQGRHKGVVRTSSLAKFRESLKLLAQKHWHDILHTTPCASDTTTGNSPDKLMPTAGVKGEVFERRFRCGSHNLSPSHSEVRLCLFKCSGTSHKASPANHLLTIANDCAGRSYGA